jgi:hypothetical protein
MRGSVPPISQYALMAWCSVKKEHRGNFTFTFNLDLMIIYWEYTETCNVRSSLLGLYSSQDLPIMKRGCKGRARHSVLRYMSVRYVVLHFSNNILKSHLTMRDDLDAVILVDQSRITSGVTSFLAMNEITR